MLRFDRPVVYLDLETTGLSDTDRVVEVCAIRREGDHERVFDRLVNPGMPMPPEATAVNGITDAMLADAPPFARIAVELRAHLSGADLVGYNLRRFDVPVLRREFGLIRAFPPWDPDGALLDLYEVFMRREPRDLPGALKFYGCAAIPDGDRHRAAGDTRVLIDLLSAQRARYADIGETVAEMAAAVRDPSAVDEGGKLKRTADGKVVLTFGKHAGVALNQCPADYLRWALDKGVFGPDAVPLIKAVMS